MRSEKSQLSKAKKTAISGKFGEKRASKLPKPCKAAIYCETVEQIVVKFLQKKLDKRIHVCYNNWAT